MQHEVTQKQKLLDENGNIKEPGYAKTQVWQYSREDIKAPKWRIKEWDYYYIGNQEYGLCLTISDAGYVSAIYFSADFFASRLLIGLPTNELANEPSVTINPTATTKAMIRNTLFFINVPF